MLHSDLYSVKVQYIQFSQGKLSARNNFCALKIYNLFYEFLIREPTHFILWSMIIIYTQARQKPFC